MNIKEYLEKMRHELSELIHSSDNIHNIITSLKERGYDIELKFLFTILGDTEKFTQDGINGESNEEPANADGPPIDQDDKTINPYDIDFMQSLGIKWNSYGQY
jgi:hypothetical protein